MTSIHGTRAAEWGHSLGLWRHRTRPTVTRRARSHGPIAIAVLAMGCVATNPRWDGPDAGDTTGDRGATTGEATSEGSEGEPPEPMCPGAEIVCDGECRDVARDRKACGDGCVDCTQLFGSKHATCEQGVCMPPEGDDDGDDDD